MDTKLMKEVSSDEAAEILKAAEKTEDAGEMSVGQLDEASGGNPGIKTKVTRKENRSVII